MFLSPLDDRILRFFNHDIASPWIDPFALAISNPTVWWIVGGLLFAVGVTRRRKGLLRLGLALGLAVGVVDLVAGHGIKPWVQRERPCVHHAEIRTPRGCGGRYGFPSNHAANGMAVVVTLAFFAPASWAWAALAAALLTGLSRLYLGVHYPSDVLAGFALGAILAAVLATLQHAVGKTLARRRLVNS